LTRFTRGVKLLCIKALEEGSVRSSNLLAAVVLVFVALACFASCGKEDRGYADSTGDDDTASDDDTDDDLDDDTSDDDDDDYFPYFDLFTSILNRLVSDFWNESGDWDGDMMGDATSFAPEVLFGYGLETDDRSLIDKGAVTCLWELDLASRVLHGDLDAAYPAGMGALAILWGHIHQVDPGFAGLYELMLPVGSAIASMFYEGLADFVGDVFPDACYLGIMAHVNHLAARYETGEARDEAMARGRNLIEIAYEDLWDPQLQLFEAEGTYHGHLASNGVMLLAVAGDAYLTGDAEMQAKAEQLFASMDDALWDDEQGGYWDDIDHMIKHMSTTSITLRGVVALYEATGDETYRRRAEELIAWVEDYLYLGGLCYHHWTPEEGRATYYCTGCNFLLLDGIFYLHRVGSGHEWF